MKIQAFMMILFFSTSFGENPAKTRSKRQFQPPSGSGSQRVGSICRYNTDCISGAYCASSICQCWSTHVDVNSYCWPKINPDQSGCTYGRQCDAIWPGATCENSICRCPFNRPPQQTRDGPVCYIPGNCPTNNQWPKYIEPGTNNVQGCTILTLDSSRSDQLGCIYDEMYDCIDFQDPRDGYCCPTRSFACIQPLDNGYSTSGSSSETRFFFNSISQSCQQFQYLGAGGNGNNFMSKIQCESYCSQGCKRGHPEYLPTNPTVNIKTKIRYCSTSSSNDCNSNYYQCHSSGSTQMCCPKVSFICSKYGGLPPAGFEPSAPYDVGTYPDTRNSDIIRWYYDDTTKTCSTFAYRGMAGNFNNFLSRDDCEAYCAQAVCEQGEPLKDNSGVNPLSCTGNGNCPTTHECKSNVCCPTKYTICNQPKVSGGTCNNYANRYWFNTRTGSCEKFLYTGCRGNANNFETFLDCQDFCSSVGGEPKCPQGTALKDSSGNFYSCSGSGSTSCPANYECQFDGRVYGCCASRSYTCSLATSAGTACGPSSSTRWYFDTTTRTCKTFIYHGCDGNSNNFATQIDCVDYCRAGGCPDFGEPLKDLYTGQVRLCGPDSGFSCPNTHTCTAVNSDNIGNNVASVVIQPGTVINYCCPKKRTVCSYTANSGAQCNAALTRYHFSTITRNCEEFTYYGCGGNSNNFPSKISCQNYCTSAACNPGEEIYKEKASNQIRYCNPNTLGTCPIGYKCIFDSLNQRSVCCGATNLGVCPSNSRAYIDGFTGEARQCTANVAGSCPSNYICYFNPTKRLFYCCSNTTPAINPSAVCGPNKNPYIVGGAAVTCAQAAAPKGCPMNYQCIKGVVSASTNSVPYYCCQNTGNVINPPQSQECPSGYQLYAPNGQPQYCSPYMANSCPGGGICQLILSTRRYQCCTKIGSQPQPNNQKLICTNGAPYVNPQTGTAATCSPGGAPCLSSAYRCEPATNAPNVFICCPNNGAPGTSTSVCGNNQQPFMTFGQPTPCSISINNCPANYQCKYDLATSKYYCCPAASNPNGITNGFCPLNKRPYMIFGNQPQTCSPYIANTCPFGYSCEKSPMNGFISYCCSQNAYYRGLAL